MSTGKHISLAVPGRTDGSEVDSAWQTVKTPPPAPRGSARTRVIPGSFTTHAFLGGAFSSENKSKTGASVSSAHPRLHTACL